MYTISVYASKMPFPIHFTVHTWIVTEYDGIRDRFDVFGFLEDKGERHGYLYKNFSKPDCGCPMFAIGSKRIFENRFIWDAEVLFEIHGEENSDAEKIYTLLHTDIEKIPSMHTYHMFRGPNSNSFTQWVLDYAAPGKYRLPRAAFGRGWRESS